MKRLLPKSVNNPQGFTLIELLVVITILAFLAVIGIAAYSNAQKQARDGRRRADVEAISSAMESNYDPVNATYPANAGGFYSNNAIPTDPDPATPYVVTQTNPTCSAANRCFMVCATLETATGNATSSIGAGLGTTTTGTHFCRKSQQNS